MRNSVRAFVAAMAVSACYPAYRSGVTSARGVVPNDPNGGINVAGVEVKAAFLSGGLGGYNPANGPASYLALTGWGNMLDVNIAVDTASSSTMAILHVPGGFDNPNFEPGYEASGGDSYDPQSVSVTGCAGPERDNWQYDQPADSTDVKVLSTPGEPGYLRMEFTSHFGNELVIGHVDYRRAKDTRPRMTAVAGGIYGDVAALRGMSVESTHAALVQDTDTRVTLSFTVNGEAGQVEVFLPGQIENWETPGTFELACAEGGACVTARSGATTDHWDVAVPADRGTLTVTKDATTQWYRYAAQSRRADGSTASIQGIFGLQHQK